MSTVKISRPSTQGGKSESQVQSEIRLALGQLPDVRMWRNNVGQLTQRAADGRKSVVRFGLAVGSSDLIAIVAPMGRWLVVEVKEESWRPAKSGAKFKHEEEQRLWIGIVESFGGVGGFARSVDEAMQLVERARKQ